MTTVDLAWDFTGDEDCPLLGNATAELLRSEQKCVLTRRQVQHLLHNLQEVSQILNDENRRNSTIALNRRTQNVENNNADDQGVFSSTQRFFWSHFAFLRAIHLSFAVIMLLVISLVVDSAIDAVSCPHIPYTSIVASSIEVLGLISYYFLLVRKFQIGEELSKLEPILSYATSSFLFASLYTTFPCSEAPGEHLNCPLFILRFLNNLHVSFSIFTFSYYGQLQPSCWNSLLLITIQMVVSYCHLIMLVAVFFTKMIFKFKKPSINEEPIGILQAHYDDTSSYMFNQNPNLYESVDILARDMERSGVASCPPDVGEIFLD